MYNDIHLEKSLYNLTGKTFTQALSSLDPDEAYLDDPTMNPFDAFQRQLKRFSIDDKSPVEAFFYSSQSAVLFPEFVRRSIEQGINIPALSAIVAAKTITNAIDYRGISISHDATPEPSQHVPQASALPQTTLTLDAPLVVMKKFGRTVSIAYEAIRQQSLDVFAVTLRNVGAQIASYILDLAVETLSTNAQSITAGSASLSYTDLVRLWSLFPVSNLSVILASPDTMADILSLEQMKYSYDNFMNTGMIKTPFGATLVKTPSLPNGTVIGLDDSSALQMIQNGPLVIDYDKLADKQLDRTHTSITVGFSKIQPDAVKILTIPTA